jgi:hypothetical protein
MSYNIALTSTPDKYVILVDKTMSEATINRIVNRIRLEYLLEKADFQEDILEIGEEIKGCSPKCRCQAAISS